MPNSLLPVLIRQLGQAFDLRSWHGTSLWGSLRGVTQEEAAWRPQAGRHNVWELALHTAYWKYRVYRLITDREPRSFDLRGSNFFPRPDAAGESVWEADRDLLASWHHRLLEAVEGFDEARLEQHVGSDWFTYQDLILGGASHDLYHAGQIQLLKRLRQGDGAVV